MANSDGPSRRAVLTAVGSAGLCGITVGSVAAASENGDGDDAGKEGGDNAPHTDRGIVVRFEDCGTVHVRGSKKKLDSVIAHYTLWIEDGPGSMTTRATIEEDPPLTIDDRYLNLEPDDYYIPKIEYWRDGQPSSHRVRKPDDMDCGF
ncbi:MAG: hypothetical protein ABEJ26_10695 [Halosimplex sp.]